eukprot:12247779-Ditylum_brightwellii.AAC.1
MQLFTSIDIDPNNVNYFCCNKSNRDKAIVWLDNFPKLLRTSFSFEDQCLIHNSDDKEPARSYRTETAENTADAIRSFDKVLNGMMDTVDDIAPADKNDVEEDHLCNCWTAPPRSVYFRFSNTPSALPTEAETVSTVSNINAPSGTKESTAKTIAFLDRVAKQMDKWENAAKDQAKECAEKEKEITHVNIDEVFQVLTNNVNGFNTLNDGNELLEELTILKELKISAACLQETNKNWY